MSPKTPPATAQQIPPSSASTTRDAFVVVIVDDDDLDRYIIARSFKSLGDDVELIEVAESSDAVNAIQTHKPDLALLDLQMPGMTGMEVLSALSKDVLKDAPPPHVLMLSSSSRDADRTEALAKGAMAYHVKPATLDGFRELAEHVKSTYLM